MNRRGLLVLLALAFALAMTAPGIPAQTRPKLAEYFTEIPNTVLDARYVGGFAVSASTEDLDGDGQQDLILLGFEHPASGGTTWAPQPGRVFLGDGNGHFAAASAAMFPVDTLRTIMCRPSFADFNGDERPDMFLACGGWDVLNGPGEQNRLYLSRPEGGWRDATDTLPQLSDRTNPTASLGDISGRGLVDIFVGNGNASLNRILSYTLLNNGSGQFTPTSTNIPAGPGQLLDPFTGHQFSETALLDLDDDGLPELIVGGSPNRGAMNLIVKPRTVILWNRDGVFVETDTTELSAPAAFPNTHFDVGFRRIDVNGDGLPDLIVLGGQNTLHGWFVQIFVNHGNREFVDETADRVPQVEASAGIDGVDTAAIKPSQNGLQVLDFNQDGAPDFSIEFTPDNSGPFTPEQPLIWLNDGTGHFTTLKAGDFVTAGKEKENPNVFGRAHLMATRNGFSFISTTWYNGKLGHPLTVTGLLATKPYRVTPPQRQSSARAIPAGVVDAMVSPQRSRRR